MYANKKYFLSLFKFFITVQWVSYCNVLHPKIYQIRGFHHQSGGKKPLRMCTKLKPKIQGSYTVGIFAIYYILVLINKYLLVKYDLYNYSQQHHLLWHWNCSADVFIWRQIKNQTLPWFLTCHFPTMDNHNYLIVINQWIIHAIPLNATGIFVSMLKRRMDDVITS